MMILFVKLNLGNMSSPSINRWGLNLFWYRFWYNDKTNAFLNNQDDLINKFVLIYLHYSSMSQQNVFISKYWYSNTKQMLKIYYDDVFNGCFRVAEYKNRVTGEKKAYKLRIKIKNLHLSKIWILRYQMWLIINFYCFQPPKKKNFKKKIPLEFNSTFNYENKNIENSDKSLFFRYRSVFCFFLQSYLNDSVYYKF